MFGDTQPKVNLLKAHGGVLVWEKPMLMQTQLSIQTLQKETTMRILLSLKSFSQMAMSSLMLMSGSMRGDLLKRPKRVSS